jgi:succinyl-CoA synthetase alpha subunit
MIFTHIRKNRYHDSINLTILTKAVNTTEGVDQAQVVLGTEANKEVLKEAGLYNEDVEKAGPNDMVVAIEAEDESVMNQVMKRVEDYIQLPVTAKDADALKTVTSWEQAKEALPEANLALISTVSEAAITTIEEALEQHLHVFAMSEEISIEEEERLKNKAHQKGLLLMGPKSSSGLISGITLGFMPEVRTGNIGVVGTSDAGIQEVVSNIDHLEGGVMHAIPTGERDLTEKVKGTTMRDALVALDHHSAIDVLVIISQSLTSKRPEKMTRLLQSLSKPVVVIDSEEKSTAREGNVYRADTVEVGAQIAVALAFGDEGVETAKGFKEYTGKTQEISSESGLLHDLLASKPQIINVGLKNIGERVQAFGGEIVHLEE